MDSFTLNKIAGAVLGTCLVGMGIGLVAQGIYTPETPKKPGYALPEPKPETAGGGAKPAETPLPVLLAKADAKKGEADAKVCGACHNFAEGAGTKVGPDLYGVVDREKGKEPGFDYSAGMKAKGGKWTYADLNEFITKPSAYVQGTKMGFGGEESPEKRADILAYLRTLSKSPVALPAVTDADNKAAGGGGGQASAGNKPAGESFVALVAAADPKKGEKDTQVCQACHNFKKGEGTKVGPDLYGVVDRPKGSEPGFSYSDGMKKKGGNWTYDDLNQFLTKPSAYVQGTMMGFAGEENEKKRAEIVAYLRSNADKPAPLPAAGEKKAEAAPAEKPKEASAGGAPAEGGAAPAGGGDEAFIKLVAAADPKKGQSDAQVCSACHNLKKGAGTLVGPELWGVVDREKGKVPGFDYSAGMKAKGGKWTYADLNEWLLNPAKYIPGTKMGYAGEANEKKRAEIVAFLRTLADTPAPLPGAGGDAAKPQPAADKPASPETKPESQNPPPPPNKPEAPQANPPAPPAPPSPPAPAPDKK